MKRAPAWALVVFRADLGATGCRALAAAAAVAGEPGFGLGPGKARKGVFLLK
jgi:hypothetical protein